MGSIYKRGHNYYLDLRANGKRIRKKVGPSRKLAELALKDTEVKIARNKYDFTTVDSALSDLFKSFLDHSKTNHMPMTTLRYWHVIRNFEVFLALKYANVSRVSQLTMEIFENFKEFRRSTDTHTIGLSAAVPQKIPRKCKRASTRTLNYEIKTLKSIFSFGIKREICRDNPCMGVKTLKVVDSKQPRFLTEKECKLFLRNCEKDIYPIFFTFLSTGMRLGELLHLQWEDIDFKRKKLSIRKKEFWIPKTSEREIPLSNDMFALLLKMRPSKFERNYFVFPGKDGKVLRRKLRDDLIRIAEKVRISDFTKIHTLRHTFASNLVMKGVDLPTVQKLLGHANIQTTMIYAHLAPDHLAAAVNKLDLT